MRWLHPQPAQAPPRCTECNSPAINDQCTNHRSALCIRRTRTADVDADIKMTIGIPIVTGLPRLPTVYQSSKTVKRQSKQQKMTIGVPIVTCLHRVHRIHKVCVRRPRPPNTQIQNFLKIWSRQYVAKACAKLIMSWITGNEWLVALVNVKNPSENDKTVYLILDLHCVYFSRFCSKLILGCQMW